MVKNLWEVAAEVVEESNAIMGDECSSERKAMALFLRARAAWFHVDKNQFSDLPSTVWDKLADKHERR